MSGISTKNEDRDRRGAFFAALMATLVFVLCFVGGVLTQLSVGHQSVAADNRPLPVFWEAWDLVAEGFYGEIPPARERTYGAIRGMLSLLEDPYTIFLEPQPSNLERDRLAGAYGGIGVDLWRNLDGEVVLSPYPASPAESAGVLSGDILTAIDGQALDDITVDDVRSLLRGEVGTEVILTLSRPPAPPFELAVARAQIRIPSVTFRILEQDPSIGYVHITGFTERTPEEAEAALDSLLASGAASLILDLRDNGGGLLSPAVDVASLLLDGGVVLYETRRGDDQTTLRARSGGIASDTPLAVLVNRSTASAAEIVAGAVQARDRGTMIGVPTYGKGSVQLIYALSDGSALHVTSAVWLLPNREPISADGLTPDILVEPTNSSDDNQLERAIQHLQASE
jgi:carboxyl-terminal processing protease